MIVPPAIVVHGIGDARRALAAGKPFRLLSAPDAARFAGPAFWRALVAAARGEPGGALIADDILDCGEAGADAIAAMRLGQRTLVLHPTCPAFANVASAAATVGARILTERPPALDMAARNADAQLAGWLAQPLAGWRLDG
jgi:hypothetical protein